MERNAEIADASLPPTGTVAFLVTDIEESSRLHERHPERMAFWQGVHDLHIRAAVGEHGGHVYRFTGDGFCAAFTTAEAALRAAMAAQASLFGESWDADLFIRARMAVFAGPVERRDGEYHGRTLSRGSRLLGAAHGAQTLLNRAAYELLLDRSPTGIDLRELGTYLLQGTDHRETIFQAVPEGQPAEFPPLAPHKGARREEPRGLEPEANPFFGRERETRDLRRLLASKSARVVTVTGLGGMGKSRLAAHVARRMEPAFPAGALLVRCEPIKGREALAAAVADALGLPSARGEPEGAVVAALRERRCLIVLDGFEGLTEHAAAVVGWASTSPGSRFLVTSRWPLGAANETDYPLGPLDCDGPAQRLFMDAAARAKPGFRSTRESAAAVVRVCERLDGMPLALLIAAGCLKWCPLPALERMLGADLLEVDGPGRASLRSVIEASVRALPAGEGAFLARLVVFENVFTVDDVAEVLRTPRSVAIARLDRLSDFSLVQVVAGRRSPCFRLLAPVREALRAGHEVEEDDRYRHLLRIVGIAQAVAKGFAKGDYGPASVEFFDYIADFRQAVEHAEQSDDGASVILLTRSLVRTALEMGLWSEFDRWAALAERRAESTGDRALAMAILGYRGARAQRRGDLREARVQWIARRDLALSFGDLFVEADAEYDLANLALAENDRDEAVERLRRASALARETGDVGLVALALSLEATIACDEGDLDRARQAAATAIQLGAIKGGHAFFGVLLKGGRVLRRTKDCPPAEEALARMLKSAAERHNVHEAALALLELGLLYADLEDHTRARRALQAGRLLYASTGERLRDETERTLALLGDAPMGGGFSHKNHSWEKAALDILSSRLYAYRKD